jgi:hypothetical protein
VKSLFDPSVTYVYQTSLFTSGSGLHVPYPVFEEVAFVDVPFTQAEPAVRTIGVAVAQLSDCPKEQKETNINTNEIKILPLI